jgi:hypothetical protein
VPFTEAVSVAIGAGLYLANVPDDAPTVRARPIASRNSNVTPEARILGRGIAAPRRDDA